MPFTKMSFPQPLIAGDAWAFAKETGRYGGYTAAITFASGPTKLLSNATSVGDKFQWLIAGTETAPLTPTGRPTPFFYTVTMTDGTGNRYTVESGAVTVVPDIAASADVGDATTPLQRMLKACDETLIELMGQKTSMVQFAGQMYQFHELDKLFAVRNSIQARVQAEADALRGASSSRRIVTVFVNS
jgi:hypothetical protein